jgi:hypothetical protein
MTKQLTSYHLIISLLGLPVLTGRELQTTSAQIPRTPTHTKIQQKCKNTIKIQCYTYSFQCQNFNEKIFSVACPSCACCLDCAAGCLVLVL